MAKGKNMIRKQVLYFQYNGKTDGLALQKEVSDWCNAILIPEMEQVFDTVSDDDMYITIDSLKIDAVVNKEDWQDKLRNKLLIDLKEKINNYRKSNDEDGNNEEISFRKQDALVLFYFENGILPWWSEMLIEVDFKSLLLNWVKEDKNDLRKKALAANLKKILSRNVIVRIVNILPAPYSFALLKDLYKQNEKFIDFIGEFFKSEKGISIENSQKILNLTFQFVVANDQNIIIKNEAMVQSFYSHIKNETGVDIKIFNESDLVKKISVKNKTEFEKLLKTVKSDNNKDSMQKRAANGIYIDNAGAVIIAAFLPGLFNKLKLVNQREELNAQLASLIIQYAVSGNLKMEEYELVLPKILCGLDIEDVVAPTIQISLEQAAEVNEMLSSLIEHWSVLKNTTVAGLQETFLKRPGKLTENENGWLLEVEQKSYDMLLNQLPWNISMIKLPWMKGIVKTEWV